METKNIKSVFEYLKKACKNEYVMEKPGRMLEDDADRLLVKFFGLT